PTTHERGRRAPSSARQSIRRSATAASSGQGMHTGYRSYGARHATEYTPWANANIEEYSRLGCKVLNLPGNDISTYLDGLKARAARAHVAYGYHEQAAGHDRVG